MTKKIEEWLVSVEKENQEIAENYKVDDATWPVGPVNWNDLDDISDDDFVEDNPTPAMNIRSKDEEEEADVVIEVSEEERAEEQRQISVQLMYQLFMHKDQYREIVDEIVDRAVDISECSNIARKILSAEEEEEDDLNLDLLLSEEEDNDDNYGSEAGLYSPINMELNSDD